VYTTAIVDRHPALTRALQRQAAAISTATAGERRRGTGELLPRHGLRAGEKFDLGGRLWFNEVLRELRNFFPTYNLRHPPMTRRSLALAVLSLWTCAFSLAIATVQAAADSPDLPAAAKGEVDFVKQIEPFLRTTCVSCHGPEAEEGGLRVDLRDRLMVGGDGGKVIVPGESADSRLIHLVAGVDESGMKMPPEGEGTPLTDEQIGLLRAWIDQGARWPEKAFADAQRKGAEHWAFQPIERPEVPMPRRAEWVQNPIDAFVSRRLETEQIEPSPPADKHTLIRRLYLDLLGLPPSPQEVAAFVEDDRNDAYERLVDRVLRSPHYGERWGRHWLDLARYADSDGYEKDRPRPNAWRYREWVIDALNADMPFDEFTVKQVAGDMLSEAAPQDRIATGFHRNTLHNTEGGVDPEEDRVKKTVDRTNTVGTIWLGLTVGCAQCHSHKYDPMTQREYYSLYAFFNSIEEKDVDLSTSADGKEKRQARAVAERANPRPTRVHIRGNFLDKGEAVPVDTPAVLPPIEPRGQQSDRLDLAHWLVDADNPLTARVTVNRIWSRYFGRGIVSSVDDFGLQGENPSHPELLDWLAGELIDSGWRLKHVHKLIVTSNTYRQSSAHRPELVDIDPENVLLARQSRQRVEAEIIRDAALAVSGLLDRTIGGPSVRPPQPAEYSNLTYANSARWKVSPGKDRYRRGLYTFFQRTSPYPMLMTFDSPDSTQCAAQRSTSNTPLQALTLWNDPVFFECAQALGRRIVAEANADQGSGEKTIESRVAYAFQLCLAREPNDDEVSAVVDLYDEQLALAQADPQAAAAIVGKKPKPEGIGQAELAAWVMVGRTLMNLDEFITKE